MPLSQKSARVDLSSKWVNGHSLASGVANLGEDKTTDSFSLTLKRHSGVNCISDFLNNLYCITFCIYKMDFWFLFVDL